MQVFKSVFLILKKIYPQIVIYIVIFVPLWFVIANLSADSSTTDFTQDTCKVAIVNEFESNNVLINNIEECFSSSMKFFYIDNNIKDIEDLIFYGGADCVVFFDDDYLNKFLKDGNNLKVQYRPDSTKSTYFSMLFDKYFNLLNTYDKTTSYSFEDISKLIVKDFEQSTDIEMLDMKNSDDMQKLSSVLTSNGYTICVVVLMSVMSILLIYNRDELIKRNTVSSTSIFKVSAQKYCACLLVALLVFIILVVLCIIVYPLAVFTVQGTLMILNMLLYTIVIYSIAYMFGSIIKKDIAVAIIVNLISLPLAFISGMFVPRYLMPNALNIFAKILPTSWYVNSIEVLQGATQITAQVINEVLLGFGILVVFIAGFIFLGSFIQYKKRKINN